MRALWMATWLAFALVPGRVAGQETAGKPGSGLVVVGIDGMEHVVSQASLDALPIVTVMQEGGKRRFEGPLLWTLLDHMAAVDAPRFHDQVRQTVQLTGQDGYTAILSMGEIAPEFENKQVVVAERMDGQELGPGHMRIVVPGDKRGGRGVHDLIRITVAAPPR